MAVTVEHWDWSLIRTRCRAEALRILRRPQDADDAVQEALTRAWRSRHACRNPEAPIPWCLQITRHEAVRLIGRRRPRAGVAPLDDEDHVEDAHAGQERVRVLLRVDVHRALENLPPHERQLIALRYLHDFSHSEIAEMLEIPEATARVRLHRVHKRLETLL
jgi:RNA polymerase sigma-70 factor (ECF subfamily)